MVDVEFVITAIVSCVVGGFWVGLTTFASEKGGGTWGGLVGGLPSLEFVTTVSLGFLVVDQEALTKAMLVCPIVGLPSSLSYLLWVFVPMGIEKIGIKRRWVSVCVVVAVNLVFWLGVSVPLSLWGVDYIVDYVGMDGLVTVSLSFLFAVFVVGALMKLFEFQPPPKSTLKVGIITYGVRSSAGALLMLAVVCASQASPVLSGALSAFPIFSLASFSALMITNGHEMVVGTATSMGMGVVGAYTYSLLVGVTLMRWGIWWSCTFAVSTSFLLVSLPTLFLLKKRDSMLQRSLSLSSQVPVKAGGIDSTTNKSASDSTEAVELVVVKPIGSSAVLSMGEEGTPRTGDVFDDKAGNDLPLITKETP